jgi:hypothetical protein
VDRRHPDRSGILNRWRSLVSEGLSLLIFAEGTRSSDGHTARFKGGSFLLAIEAGLPVVPIAVIGTRKVMPKNRLRTEPAEVMLVVHDPIPAPALERPTARDAKAFADRVRRIVSQTVESRQFGASYPAARTSPPPRTLHHIIRRCSFRDHRRRRTRSPAAAPFRSIVDGRRSFGPGAKRGRLFLAHPDVDEIVGPAVVDLVADPPTFER